jgi:hypothetical protein
MTDTLEATQTAAPAEGAAPAPAAPRPIYELIADAMIAIDAVGKNGYNKHGNYAFRGIDDVINAVGPIFRQLRIVPIPKLQKVTYRDVLTSTGKPSKETTLEIVYRFRGPAGDYEDVVVPGESMDSADKGSAQAMSVAYRIALLQLLCIPTGDPDPDSFQPERGAPARGGRSQSGESFDDARPAAPQRPAFNPGPAAAELMAGLLSAKHRGALTRVWKRCGEAVELGAITAAEATALKAKFAELGPKLPADPDAAVTAPAETPAVLEGELVETGETA